MPPDPPLSWFELPKPFIEPALQACRMFNTALDAAFYDVPALAQGLRAHGEELAAWATGDAAGRLDLSALKDPEGSLLVVDATKPPMCAPSTTSKSSSPAKTRR